MQKMQIYDELKARGLIAQVTDEERISKLVNEGKATFYIGFDPTADSLHVGHFMALCLMKRLQMAGKTDRADRRRYRIHRRSFRKNGYAFYDDTGADSAQL